MKILSFSKIFLDILYLANYFISVDWNKGARLWRATTPFMARSFGSNPKGFE